MAWEHLERKGKLCAQKWGCQLGSFNSDVFSDCYQLLIVQVLMDKSCSCQAWRSQEPSCGGKQNDRSKAHVQVFSHEIEKHPKVEKNHWQLTVRFPEVKVACIVSQNNIANNWWIPLGTSQMCDSLRITIPNHCQVSPGGFKCFFPKKP